jgi:hypothetical protein
MTGRAIPSELEAMPVFGSAAEVFSELFAVFSLPK